MEEEGFEIFSILANANSGCKEIVARRLIHSCRVCGKVSIPAIEYACAKCAAKQDSNPAPVPGEATDWHDPFGD